MGDTVSLPLYYRESFFFEDSLFHSEPGDRPLGVEGDALPYTAMGDDFLSILLLCCFIMMLLVYAHSHQTIIYHLKNLFYIPRTEKVTTNDAVNHFRLFPVFALVDCILLAIAYYSYFIHVVNTTLIIDTSYEFIAIFTAVFALYFIVKYVVYNMANVAFFDSKKCQQWNHDFVFIIAIESVVLLPMVVLQTYLGFSLQSTVYYIVFILLLVKIITFYKVWVIFFRQMSLFLQIILYLCALELRPLLTLWGSLVLITNIIIVKF